MLFKNFFVVSGRGVSKTSSLMAFDKALAEAGISQCNLVSVSSILPSGAKAVKPVEIKPGSITFTVLARADGVQGEEVTAGVAWACCKCRGKETYGIVAEDHGNKSKGECERDLKVKIQEMAEVRKMTIIKYDSKIVTIKEVPENSFGCAVAALIYVP
jgi:arginine decarboxylase